MIMGEDRCGTRSVVVGRSGESTLDYGVVVTLKGKSGPYLWSGLL